MSWEQTEEPDGTPQGELIYRISEISEEGDCAQWLDNCEHQIWEAIFKPGTTYYGYTDHPILITDKIKIFELIEQAGGWPVVLEKEGPTIIPLNEWKKLHEKWLDSNPKYKNKISKA